MSLVVCEPQGSGVRACCIAVLSAPWNNPKCTSLKRVMRERETKRDRRTCVESFLKSHRSICMYKHPQPYEQQVLSWPTVTIFRCCCFSVKRRRSKLVPVRVSWARVRWGEIELRGTKWLKWTMGEEEVLFTCGMVTSEAVWLLGKPDMMSFVGWPCDWGTGRVHRRPVRLTNLSFLLRKSTGLNCDLLIVLKSHGLVLWCFCVLYEA